VRLHASLLRFPLKLRTKVSITDDEERKPSRFLPEALHRLKEERLLLNSRQATNCGDNDGIIRNPQASATRKALRLRQGHKPVEVEAQRDYPDLPGNTNHVRL
jgi:hypothetical protein